MWNQACSSDLWLTFWSLCEHFPEVHNSAYLAERKTTYNAQWCDVLYGNAHQKKRKMKKTWNVLARQYFLLITNRHVNQHYACALDCLMMTWWWLTMCWFGSTELFCLETDSKQQTLQLMKLHTVWNISLSQMTSSVRVQCKGLLGDTATGEGLPWPHIQASAIMWLKLSSIHWWRLWDVLKALKLSEEL